MIYKYIININIIVELIKYNGQKNCFACNRIEPICTHICFFLFIKTRSYNVYINISTISNFYNSLNNGKLQSGKVDTQ